MSIHSAHIVPHPPLIVPSVGKGQEEIIRTTVQSYCNTAKKIAAARPDVIIFISPHSVMYSDYIHISPGRGAFGNLEKFGSPDKFRLVYDFELAEEIALLANYQDIPAGSLGEKNPALDHGTMVPMHFIDNCFPRYKALRISISGLPLTEHYRLGQCIKQAVENKNRRVVIVASGDLSHKLTEDGPYGFAEEGPAFDRTLTDAMKQADFLQFLNFDDHTREAAAECGLSSFAMMAGAFDGMGVKTEFLSYEGTFGVGYAVCGYESIGEDPERNFLKQFTKMHNETIKSVKQNESELVKLARRTLEAYIKTGKKIGPPEDISRELLQKQAGVFVSIKNHGRLRGCIGTISPTSPHIAGEIIQNAISAGIEDPRFLPVKAHELDELSYSVDVLQPPEPVHTLSELDAEKYGVIVSRDNRRGLLLPNLEGVDTVEKQLSIALDKAGISPSESYNLERFEVVRYT